VLLVVPHMIILYNRTWYPVAQAGKYKWMSWLDYIERVVRTFALTRCAQQINFTCWFYVQIIKSTCQFTECQYIDNARTSIKSGIRVGLWAKNVVNFVGKRNFECKLNFTTKIKLRTFVLNIIVFLHLLDTDMIML